MKTLKFIAPLLIALVALGLQQAKADTYSFDLSTGNPGISGFTGPYVNVNVNLTSSTTATITFTSLTNSGNIYLMGDGSTNALNVNASSFTVGTVTGTNNGGGTPGPFTVNNFSGQTVDGFGSFNLTIDSFDGFGHSSDSTTFTLTNTSGSWANAMAVLFANAGGSLAAAHIFVAVDGTTYVNLNATGYAANGGQVPDGGTTVMLLGAALGALGLVRRHLTS